MCITNTCPDICMGFKCYALFSMHTYIWEALYQYYLLICLPDEIQVKVSYNMPICYLIVIFNNLLCFHFLWYGTRKREFITIRSKVLGILRKYMYIFICIYTKYMYHVFKYIKTTYLYYIWIYVHVSIDV